MNRPTRLLPNQWTNQTNKRGDVDQLFTEQLVEANPILNDISDCMTAEGKCLAAKDLAGLAEHTAAKEAANGRLQACAAKYNALMKEHREAYAASQSAAAFAKTT